MRTREIRPAMPFADVLERDRAYKHAVERGVQRDRNARVKVHLRCNQPAPDGTICSWDEWKDLRAGTAERDAKRLIAEHIRVAHPSLLANYIASRAWVQLADV